MALGGAGVGCSACACLPVHGDGEDALDVGQHRSETCGILVEVHLRQHQRSADVFDDTDKTPVKHQLN